MECGIIVAALTTISAVLQLATAIVKRLPPKRKR